MNNTKIKEDLEYLKMKKLELENIKGNISEKRTEFKRKIENERIMFEESLTPLKEKENEVFKEFNLYAEKKITITLGDLINELSSLTGINISDIGINISTRIGYWGKNKLNEMIELMEDENQIGYCMGYNADRRYYWDLYLFSNKYNQMYDKDSQKFCYHFILDFKLDEIQNDGKTLLEHCVLVKGYDGLQGLYYTLFSLEKNIGELNLNLSLNDLIYKDTEEKYVRRFYPNELIEKAVINCLENKNEQNNSHKNSKIKLLTTK